MKIYALNGSPRKHKNTATVLEKALEGAASVAEGQPVETRLIHLYSLDFSPCVSCFECKRLGGKNYGRCALRDPLAPVLEELSQADGIIFGSPVFFGDVTGKMRCFLERLLFPYVTYGPHYETIAPKRMPTAFFYTMNVPEPVMDAFGYVRRFSVMEDFLERVFSKPLLLHVNNTYQFDDYSKYKVECFSEQEKAAYRERQFPEDCRKAFEIGASLGRAARSATMRNEASRS